MGNDRFLSDRLYVEFIYVQVLNIAASAKIVPTLNWIKTQSVTNQEFVNRLKTELDTGEAEAIALAMELNAKRLLMDERIGRAVGESE